MRPPEHPVNSEPFMPQSAAPNPQADADRLEAAADQAIAACGGDVRDALKALIVANEYLESEVCELMQAVSHAYVRGRFKTYTG
jgi:stage V sporulation protein SpoVS